ncbi:MAG: hypothetical protein COU31_02565 [Candidatus Magasanikbacteria bacterium CG10_big_fil_rev_8_21_14_0_10_40_10]|uniref:Uncharacterized protein n=1 Tax=Candidatus Magasanikbacteria bacterium CG10_big_fil_rev_8_21_14_0_10_40_10 TaxID=1974648 RepID=A0A2M6W3Y9_9BACT|nr:MAG: hypothetical protein COU31_02565 [Candidatus Magasanikbacteria bacterium CG10_big_fil_rev_8_21_14_0_10_40_10]
MKHNYSLSAAREHAKNNVALVLRRLRLSNFVPLEDVENELRRVETPFQSLLLLGILDRIASRNDEKTLRLYFSAITEWKNHLPHDDLDGMTPTEILEKYPPGPYEMDFIGGLMREYESRLNALKKSEHRLGFDINADFAQFQEAYLNRIPAAPYFRGGMPRTMRALIVEERHRAGHPEKDIEKVGVQIFAENVGDGAVDKIDEIEAVYVDHLKELDAMKRAGGRPDQRRVRAIRKQFEHDEPFHRTAREPHRFYLNYAMLLLLDEEPKETVLHFISLSLLHKPDYEVARKVRRNIRSRTTF